MGSKESRIERQLANGVKALGGMTFKFISPGMAGVPDRIVILPGGTVHFVEIKAKGGKPTKLQKRMLIKLGRLDVPALVLTGADEAAHYLDNLRTSVVCEELMNE